MKLRDFYRKTEKTVMKNEKYVKIKKGLEKLKILAKNLPKPTTDDEQKSLDNIFNEIQDFNRYLDDIIESNKK